MNFDIDTPKGMENAVAWQQRLVDSVKDGGSWAVPRSGSVYTLDKVNKVATRAAFFYIDHQIDRVFKAMGWKVTSRKEGVGGDPLPD